MISGVFGLPATGKSIFISYCAYCASHGLKVPISGHFDKYETVYTNFPCENCKKLDFDTIGENLYHDCLMIIDEVQLFADSRNYKNFASKVCDFLSIHRKLHIDILYASQTFDGMDKRIRSLTDTLYQIDRSFLGLITIRKIKPFMRFDGTAKEGYELAPLRDSLFYLPSKLYGYVDTDCLIKRFDFKDVYVEYWDELVSYDFPALLFS